MKNTEYSIWCYFMIPDNLLFRNNISPTVDKNDIDCYGCVYLETSELTIQTNNNDEVYSEIKLKSNKGNVINLLIIEWKADSLNVILILFPT